jgi:hypothetical protein
MQNQHDVSPILVIDDITPERATVMAVRLISRSLDCDRGQRAVYLRDGYPVPEIGERIYLSSVSRTADSDERASIAYARSLARLRGLEGEHTALDERSREQWVKRPWREPDVWVEGRHRSTAIWYGPNSPEGDDASMVEGENSSFTFTMYHNPTGEIDNPEDTYLVQSTALDASAIYAELKLAKIKPASLKDLFRWIVGIGSAHLAYYGGEDSWTSELPR